MVAYDYYHSPLGDILLTCDDDCLTQLSFCIQRILPMQAANGAIRHPVIAAAKRWLDIYFAGNIPDFTPPLHAQGTAFQQAVWKLLMAIPYGDTTTYGALANEIAGQQGTSHMSAQAIGGAVGKNPIGIIVPCHRVIGVDGNLTGYAGGLDKKIALLTLEGIDMSTLYLPKKGGAL